MEFRTRNIKERNHTMTEQQIVNLLKTRNWKRLLFDNFRIWSEDGKWFIWYEKGLTRELAEIWYINPRRLLFTIRQFPLQNKFLMKLIRNTVQSADNTIDAEILKKENL